MSIRPKRIVALVGAAPLTVTLLVLLSAVVVGAAFVVVFSTYLFVAQRIEESL